MIVNMTLTNQYAIAMSHDSYLSKHNTGQIHGKKLGGIFLYNVTKKFFNVNQFGFFLCY